MIRRKVRRNDAHRLNDHRTIKLARIEQMKERASNTKEELIFAHLADAHFLKSDREGFPKRHERRETLKLEVERKMNKLERLKSYVSEEVSVSYKVMLGSMVAGVSSLFTMDVLGQGLSPFLPHVVYGALLAGASISGMMGAYSLVQLNRLESGKMEKKLRDIEKRVKEEVDFVARRGALLFEKEIRRLI